MRCQQCHYCEWHDEDDSGFCHRYPPQFIENTITYPVVFVDDWCGEFRPTLNS